MEYQVADLARDVRIAIDTNNSSAQLTAVSDIDTLTIDEIITSKLVDAARMVETLAPAYLLDSGKAFATSISWNSGGTKTWGYTQLPGDFLRLSSFQMADWKRPVSIAINENDPIYTQQRSEFKGIGGNPNNPVVAIVQWPVGLVLEFYSCTSTNVAVLRARYIPIPTVNGTSIGICEKLKPAVVYYAAYLTLLSIGELETAKKMLEASNILMERK